MIPTGIHKIKHVIVIQQENRSFDSYFGTFPGADGIPMKDGKPTVCVNDPQTQQVRARRIVDHADVNGGGPHNDANSKADIDRGKMDGFIKEAESGRKGCLNPTDPACTNSAEPRRDGVSHRERHPELLDLREGLRAAGPLVRAGRVVEPARAPLPRVGMVGVLHATQRAVELRQLDPAAAQEQWRPPDVPAYLNGQTSNSPIYAWTDLTYLLHKQHVSWGYYVVSGAEPDCEDDGAETCAPVRRSRRRRASGTRCPGSTR